MLHYNSKYDCSNMQLKVLNVVKIRFCSFNLSFNYLKNDYIKMRWISVISIKTEFAEFD